MMGFTALLTYPSHVKALYNTGGMLQSQCMFRMWVMKKGSQQMMNTPGGCRGGQGQAEPCPKALDRAPGLQLCSRGPTIKGSTLAFGFILFERLEAFHLHQFYFPWLSNGDEAHL